MVVNIKWFPRLEKKGEEMEKERVEIAKFGEEMKKATVEMEKFGEEMEKEGEEMEKEGEEMENTRVDRGLGTMAEPIINDLEYVKLGKLCRKLGIDPVQILRRAYLKEVAKIEDIEQRNLSMLRCLDKEQQKEVSTELISILKSKFSMDKKPGKVGE
jgi:hypothetical protein